MSTIIIDTVICVLRGYILKVPSIYQQFLKYLEELWVHAPCFHMSGYERSLYYICSQTRSCHHKDILFSNVQWFARFLCTHFFSEKHSCDIWLAYNFFMVEFWFTWPRFCYVYHFHNVMFNGSSGNYKRCSGNNNAYFILQKLYNVITPQEHSTYTVCRHILFSLFS